jgi:photosystem II stability/assembly factor-like uncharacterized protein
LLLAIIAILAPSPARASPETDAWSKYPIPAKGEAGGWVLTGGGTGVTAIGVAGDGTIYAATEEISGSPLNGYNLFRSTDSGYSWEPLWKIPAGDNPYGEAKIISLVLPRREDSTTLYLATRYNIYKSTNGGRDFTSLTRLPPTSGATPANSALLTSFDVTDYHGSHLILAGTRDSDSGDYGGVYFFDESQPFIPWADLQVGGVPAGTGYDVLAVAFSPNFADDGQVVAVITDEDNTIVTTRVAGASWGATIGDAYLLDPTSFPPLAPWSATAASLAFPADYDRDVSGDRYIQYVGVNVGGVTGGIYVVTGVEAPDDSLAVPVFAPAPVYSLAAAGEAAGITMIDGEAFGITLVAGLTNGNVINIATGLAYTPPAAPPAENACVAIAELHGSAYFVYAGTSGTNSGFARSVDGGATFARIAFIGDDITTISDVAVSPIYSKDSTIYMVTEGSSGRRILWRTTSQGQTWDAVLTSGQLIPLASGKIAIVGNLNKVAISPNFRSDTTVFICESGNAPSIWRTTDNGFRFAPLPSKAGTTGSIDAWIVAGIKKLLIGDSLGNFYTTTSGGLTWSRAVATGLAGFSSMALSPDYESDGTILAGGSGGQVCISRDGGETWRELLATGLAGSVVVAFDPYYAENRVIYAADYRAGAKAGVRRFIIGALTGWQRIDAMAPGRVEEVGASTSARIRGMIAADDGHGLSTLYVLDTSPVVRRLIGTTAAQGGIARCLNPAGAFSPSTEAPLFEVVNPGLPSGARLSGLWCVEGHTLWSVDTAATPVALYTYQDTLTVPLTLLSPADGASSGRQTSCQVSWLAANGAMSYEVWYDIAPSFEQSPTQLYSRVANAGITGLESGITYYWRVRVGQPGTSLFIPGAAITIGAPALSRFSAGWSWANALGGSQWSPFVSGGISPSPGASGVPVRPNFQWNPADRATGYELVVARDSSFADVVVARVGGSALPVAAWACDVDLSYSTTYYWRVRAISLSSYSQWAAGIFTTEPAPSVPPPSPLSPPPQPQAPSSPQAPPGTPVYIWGLIAIFAVLTIALLVLITSRHRY